MKIIVLAKRPIAGRVKTRLCPPLSPAEAAALAKASLLDTLDAVSLVPGRHVLALDGAPGSWTPRGFDAIAQRGGDLAERIACAFADAGAPAVLIGMDTPQVTGSLLERVMDVLALHDAVLGPATDGGWWALGLHRPDGRLFERVPMSTTWTGARQLERLRECGYSPAILPTLRDVDTIGDAQAVAAEAPATRFAGTLSSVRFEAG